MGSPRSPLPQTSFHLHPHLHLLPSHTRSECNQSSTVPTSCFIFPQFLFVSTLYSLSRLSCLQKLGPENPQLCIKPNIHQLSSCTWALTKLNSPVRVSALVSWWSAVAVEPTVLFRMSVLSLTAPCDRKFLFLPPQLSPTLHKDAVVSNSIKEMTEK